MEESKSTDYIFLYNVYKKINKMTDHDKINLMLYYIPRSIDLTKFILNFCNDYVIKCIIVQIKYSNIYEELFHPDNDGHICFNVLDSQDKFLDLLSVKHNKFSSFVSLYKSYSLDLDKELSEESKKNIEFIHDIDNKKFDFENILSKECFIDYELNYDSCNFNQDI